MIKQITERPLLWLCAFYIAALGLFLWNGLRFPFSAVLLSAFLLCAGILCFIRLLKSCRVFFFMLIPVFLLAGFTGMRIQRTEAALNAMVGETAEITGVVESVDYATDRGAEMTVRVKTLDGKRCTVSVVLTTETAVYAMPGETISCTVTFLSAEAADLTAAELSYRRSHGIFGAASYHADSLSVTGSTFSVKVLFENLREELKIRLYRFLPPRAAQLLSGLVLGDRSEVPTDVKRDFRRLGISHILAVSGLHLSVILGGMEWLLSKSGMHRRYRLLLLLILLGVTVGVTGFSPSVCRAGIMWTFYLLAYFLAQTPDAYTALFAAAAFICLFDPCSVLDAGFQMSVAATFGILFLGRKTGERLEAHLPQNHLGRVFSSLVLSPLVTTLSATVFVLPVTLFSFGEISLLALPANLILNPFVTVLLIGTPLLLLVSFVPFVPLTGIFAAVIAVFARVCLFLVEKLASARGILVGVRYPFLLPVLLLTGIFCVFLCVKLKNRLMVYASFVAGIAIFYFCVQISAAFYADSAEILYHVRKKNETLSVISGDSAALIDISDGAFNVVYETREALESSRITELDAVVLTHYHKKHLYQLHKLAGYERIGCLYLPEPRNDDEAAILESLEADAAQNGIAVYRYRRGEDSITVGGASVTVFPAGTLSRSEMDLLGVSVTVGEECLVYTSAAGWELKDEPDTLDYADYRETSVNAADILLCGVHGPVVRTAFGMRETAEPYRIAALAGANFSEFFDAAAETVVSMTEEPFFRVRLWGKWYPDKN